MDLSPRRPAPSRVGIPSLKDMADSASQTGANTSLLVYLSVDRVSAAVPRAYHQNMKTSELA